MDYWSKQDAGVSPLFPPAGLNLQDAVAQVTDVVHRAPQLFGIDRSSWTLATIRSVIGWMHGFTLPGVWRLLRRFALVYKRGRAYVHSPDPLYDQKLAQITRAREVAQQDPEHVVFLYVDEHTATLRPQVGKSYRTQDETGQKATGSTGKTVRLAGALDVATGQVLTRRRDSFNVKEMYRFFYHVQEHYPQADVIYVALDNWPIHFHGYVKDNLARIHSKIRLLPLPTYALWTNPIEKFWLKLNREFMKYHPYGRDEQAFRDALDLWLDKHPQDSAALLHEVGLLPAVSV